MTVDAVEVMRMRTRTMRITARKLGAQGVLSGYATQQRLMLYAYDRPMSSFAITMKRAS
jgi:hypothetical protein